MLPKKKPSPSKSQKSRVPVCNVKNEGTQNVAKATPTTRANQAMYFVSSSRERRYLKKLLPPKTRQAAEPISQENESTGMALSGVIFVLYSIEKQLVYWLLPSYYCCMDEAHVKRVRKELKAAGVGPIGIITPESRHLAKILHDDEHIGGAVYGLYPGGLAWLVATSHRIMFMDHKPFYTTTDEMTYDIIVGVQSTRAGPFEAIILRTRVNNYMIRFANPKGVRIFIDFIEARRLEGGDYDHATDHYTREEKPQPPPPVPVAQDIGDDALDFLKRQDLAVLSTVDRTGNVHGAVVYYLIGQDKLIYMLTESASGKGRNILVHGQVALTVYEPGTMQTVQLQGIAEAETDQATKDDVFAKLVKPRPYVEGVQLPPVTKLHEGAYMVIRITPTLVSFHDYSESEA